DPRGGRPVPPSRVPRALLLRPTAPRPTGLAEHRAVPDAEWEPLRRDARPADASAPAAARCAEPGPHRTYHERRHLAGYPAAPLLRARHPAPPAAHRCTGSEGHLPTQGPVRSWGHRDGTEHARPRPLARSRRAPSAPRRRRAA